MAGALEMVPQQALNGIYRAEAKRPLHE